MNLNSLKINIDDNKIINLIIKPTNLNINNEEINDFQKALTWFRKNNVEAYMVLLD